MTTEVGGLDINFKDLREQIENIVIETRKWVREKSILESSTRLEAAQGLLIKLKELADNDIQERSVLRLTGELELLAEEIDKILSKREAGKKEDGNVAFKCNWNDKHYKAACSQKAYEFNIGQGRAWCSSPLCDCRKYTNKELSLEEHPCYESIALKEMFFAAGWDHKGQRNQPRHIHSVRQGRMAILTTRSPGEKEEERLVIGCLKINKVTDDAGAETKIYGDKDNSIEIDYGKIKIKFWDYYKNTGAPDLMVWSSGLVRYITDEAVLNILKGIGEKYKNLGEDRKKIINLVKYYENIVLKKKTSK